MLVRARRTGACHPLISSEADCLLASIEALTARSVGWCSASTQCACVLFVQLNSGAESS
jgi:hypothetical protein